MTPAQHRAQAALLRQAGNDELSRQHEMLAHAIEQRSAKPVSPALAVRTGIPGSEL
jgi:hypothetical protein